MPPGSIFNSAEAPGCSLTQLWRLIFNVSFIPSRQPTLPFLSPQSIHLCPRAFLHRLAAEEATLKRRGCLHSWAASLPEARLHNPAPEAWGPGKGSSPHMLGLKGEGTATPSPTEALLLPGLGSSSGRLKCHPWQVLGDILTSCRDGKTQKLKRTNSQIFFTNNLSDNKIKGKIQLDLAKVF